MMKNTLRMAAKGQKISSLVGRTARAVTQDHGTVEGVIVEIRYNLYPVLQLADGRTFRAGSEVEIV